VSAVARYIENQEEHHKKSSFQDEYIKLLKRFEVEYNPDYILAGCW